jgi:small subunit ribosomal protein S18
MENFLLQHDIRHLDYKDVEVLKQFLNPHGRIMPRTRTRITAQQQRSLESAVKRARFMGLLPYVQR